MGFLGCSCFLQCHCFLSGTEASLVWTESLAFWDLSILSPRPFFSHRHNTLNLYSLGVSLNSHASWIHWDSAVREHCHYYTQTWWHDMIYLLWMTGVTQRKDRCTYCVFLCLCSCFIVPLDLTYKIQIQRWNYEEFQDGSSRASSYTSDPWLWGSVWLHKTNPHKVSSGWRKPWTACLLDVKWDWNKFWPSLSCAILGSLLPTLYPD